MYASMAASVAEGTLRPPSRKVDDYMSKLFCRIWRAARRGKRHISHRFPRLVRRLSDKEQTAVFARLTGLGYYVGKDVDGISW